MLHSRRDGDKEHGQIIVLFELVLVVILVSAALVVDLGLLRNNRQILVNTLDSAALAGGSVLPVNGLAAAGNANTLINANIQANFPGLPTSATATTTRCVDGVGGDPNIASCGYRITYKCLIGADASGALITRDVPSTCDPRPSLLPPDTEGSPLTSADITSLSAAGVFTGAGATRVSSCNPNKGDKCNVVQIAGSETTPYSIAPVVGLNSGSTGLVVSAACAGPCGQGSTITPVDLVVIIDRTASMSDPDVTNTKNAADAVLGVYNPSLQRVALGLLGPSSTISTCSGSGGPAVGVNTLITGTLTAPAIAGSTTANVQSIANATGGAGTLVISHPTSTATGNLLVAGITFDGGSSTTITAPTGWQLIKRINNSTNVGIASYYRVAVAGEPASYTWTISPNARASGGILRYTGADTSNPINISSTNTGSGTTVTASTVTTTTARTALVGFYATDTNTSFIAPTGMTERFDIKNTNTAGPNGSGPTTEAATVTQATAGATGSKIATAAASAQWAAQLIALNPQPVDTYGTSTATDLGKWIPIGFTGTDTDSPAPAYNEAYTTGTPAALNPSTHIVSAISCFDSPGGTGTNLTTPIAMATYYLQNNGRPNVTWGILLETDGQPNNSSSLSPASDYTCASASAAATTAKSTTNAKGTPIQVFTVGFGIDGTNNANCPDGSGTWSGKKVSQLLANMATTSVDRGCPGTSNSDGDHYFCEPKTSDLTGIFKVIAQALYTTKSHLVQLYPVPVVWGVSTSYPSVTISGEYFTGLSKVTIGGVSATIAAGFTDGSITVTAPCTTCHGGPPIDVVVTTAGGTSSITSLDKYTYP